MLNRIGSWTFFFFSIILRFILRQTQIRPHNLFTVFGLGDRQLRAEISPMATDSTTEINPLWGCDLSWWFIGWEIVWPKNNSFSHHCCDRVSPENRNTYTKWPQHQLLLITTYASLSHCSDPLPAADLLVVLTWLLIFNKYCGDCAVVALAMWHLRIHTRMPYDMHTQKFNETEKNQTVWHLCIRATKRESETSNRCALKWNAMRVKERSQEGAQQRLNSIARR